jgi:fructose-1,6-bisphosphatase I
VASFTLDPLVGEFVLAQPDVRLPTECTHWSANAGNSRHWWPGTHAFLQHLTSGDGRYKSTSLRYVGTLVADVHRNLLKGGVFFYPGDKKAPRGKLRLLYEAHPLAYLIEQAGGKATDGKRRILDIVPDGLHMRVPLVIGNSAEIELFEALSARDP